MKISAEVDFTIDHIREFIDDASQSEIREIYDYAKEEGNIEDDCEDCSNDLDNVLDFVGCADQEDANKIFNAAAQNLRYFKIENLRDQMKMEFIQTLWSKYTQEQLEEIIKKHEKCF